ncbi:hypothetical protein BH18THE2_BH18THE2_36040 [soil metagenome]
MREIPNASDTLSIENGAAEQNNTFYSNIYLMRMGMELILTRIRAICIYII